MFKRYFKLNEAVEDNILSSEVMPLLSGKVKLKKGDSDSGESEEFALDDDAEVEFEEDNEGSENKKSDNQSKNKSVLKIKGDINQAIDALAKKQQSIDTHLKKGEKPTPLKVPEGDRNAHDYSPDFPEDAQNQIEKKKQEVRIQMQKRGRGEGGSRGLEDKIFRTHTNWRALIREFVSGAEKTKLSWSKINRRAYAGGWQAPGYAKDDNKVRVIFALDTSGSIGNDTLAVFVSEIYSVSLAFPELEMRIILWHDRVYGDIVVEPGATPDQIVNLVRSLPYKSGGTTLSSVKHYFDEENIKLEYDSTYLIVLTDGFVEPKPELPSVQHKLFLIISGGNGSALEEYGEVHEIDVHNEN